MVVLGVNAVQAIIALADFVRRDERVVLRRAFQHLDRRWANAELPNVIAMVSAHPMLYQLIGGACSVFIIVRSTYVLASEPLTRSEALSLLRGFVLLVLVQWLVQWYQAAYSDLHRRVLPER